jgi:GNAT superfamily N-acetyltransferase
MAGLYAQDALPYDPGRAFRVTDWLLANPDSGGIWIIQADGQDAGHLVLTICVSLEFRGRFALLDELYIDPAWRNCGLGPAAIAFAESWSRDQGFAALRLEVSEDNAHAQHVYRKSGFLLHDRHLMTKWL